MDSHQHYLKTFFATKPFPCDYFPDRMDSKTAVDLTGAHAQWWANILSRSGFRRSHRVCYIPSCPDCKACVSVRINVDFFSASKKMKKIMRQNQEMHITFLPNIATIEQYDLFKTYLCVRHTNSEMAKMSFEEYRAMIEDCPVDSCLLEIRMPQTARLVAVMLVDILDDGLSAVYSFFDPHIKGTSLGTYMILKLIEKTKEQKKAYVYLGYLIKELSNMSYKQRFSGLEYYQEGKWCRSFTG